MENINSHMKKFTDLLKQTAIFILESMDTNKTVDNIYHTLERTEKILNRKLTNEEFNQFTDLLVEEEMGGSSEQKQEPIFKKAKYVVEIMTSRGKVIRTASSQKGLLDVIHGQANYVVTQDGKNITTKVKAFIKERQSQQRMKKEMMKKLRESEEPTSNFFFDKLIENEEKKKREEQTQTKVFADDYESRIMAAVDAIQDPIERQKAAQIAAEQIRIKNAGGRIAPEKRPEPDPKYFDKETGEFVNPETGQIGLKQKQRVEFDPNLHPTLDPGKVVTYTPMPTRLDFNYDENAYRAALSSWINQTKRQANQEVTSTSKEFIPTLASDMQKNPYSQAAAVAGLLTPASPIFGGLLALGSGKGLKDQYDQGQFTGKTDLDPVETGLNILGVLPFAGSVSRGVSKVLPKSVKPAVSTGTKVATGAVVAGTAASALSPSSQPPQTQQTQQPIQTTRIIERDPEYVQQEGDFIIPVETRRKLKVIDGPNRRII
jgi:hypothetical protein